MRAVRFDEYGGIDVLTVDEVPRPACGAGQVLVRVKAAGINPGEAKIREGLLHAQWPATFPSGQGSDLAGIVAGLGEGVTGVSVGDEVIGWVDTRSSHAEYSVVDAANVTPKPAALPWDVAGAIPVAGFTAWAAVRAVGAGDGDTAVVSGAAGGVGAVAVQLARHGGATVVGLAGERNHGWLRGHGAVAVPYGEGVADRIRAAAPTAPTAFIDTYGDDYVELALNQLGIAPDRIDTTVRFDAVEKYGVKAQGMAAGANADILAELAGMAADGGLEIPIAATYPLARVRDAYAELARGHVRGKIVLVP